MNTAKQHKNKLLVDNAAFYYKYALTTILCMFLHTSGSSYSVKDDLNLSDPIVIVLDAGHGGKDSGCLGAYSKEKDIALSITKQVGDLLHQSHPNVKVIYTRDRDIFIPLHQRSKIANDAKADLFVSIHCNAVKNKKIHGTETYVMGLHRAEENLAVAKRENEAIYLESDFDKHYDGYDPNSPIGHIMLSTYQNIHLGRSIELASLVEEELHHTCKHSRGVKQAGFVVLRQATMPSILIETGFLTNKDDEALLSSTDGQAQVALRISKAIGKMIQSSLASDALSTIVAQENKVHKPQLDSQAELKSQHTKPQTKKEKSSIPKKAKASKYRLQIAAFKNAVEPHTLAQYEVYPHLMIKKEGQLHKIWVGAFDTLEAAIAYKVSMRERGHKGAFVVKY